MIIANGTIELKRKAATGIDAETGYPVRPSEVEWGSPIPCQIVPNSYNMLGQSNGEHVTIASYQIYIDEQPVEGERLRLRRADGTLVGEFSMMEIRPLQAVCETLIIV